MHPVAIIFGVACFGALALTHRGEAVARAAAWVMAGLWAVANLLWLFDAMAWLPVFDLPVAMLSYALLVDRPSLWRLVVAVAFAFRITLHLPGTWGMMPLDVYLHWINAAFLAALVAISWKGGRRAFIDTIVRVRGFRSLGGRPAEIQSLVVATA